MKKTVLDMVDAAASTWPEAPYALRKTDEGFVASSFSEVRAAAKAFAAWLLESDSPRATSLPSSAKAVPNGSKASSAPSMRAWFRCPYRSNSRPMNPLPHRTLGSEGRSHDAQSARRRSAADRRAGRLPRHPRLPGRGHNLGEDEGGRGRLRRDQTCRLLGGCRRRQGGPGRAGRRP